MHIKLKIAFVLLGIAWGSTVCARSPEAGNGVAMSKDALAKAEEAAIAELGVSRAMVQACHEICYYIKVNDEADIRQGKKLAVRASGQPIYNKPDGTQKMIEACREICAHTTDGKKSNLSPKTPTQTLGAPPTGYEPDTGPLPSNPHKDSRIAGEQLDELDTIVVAKYNGKYEATINTKYSGGIDKGYYFFAPLKVLKGDVRETEMNVLVPVSYGRNISTQAMAYKKGQVYLIISKHTKRTSSIKHKSLYSPDYWYDVPHKSFIIPIEW